MRPIQCEPCPPPPQPGRWRDLTPSAAAPALGRLRILDVRSPSEFHGDLGHLSGAELLPAEGLEGLAAALDPHAPLLVVCRSGRRSARAAKRLARLGFKAVFNLSGGMLAWNAAGHSACGRRHARACGGRR